MGLLRSRRAGRSAGFPVRPTTARSAGSMQGRYDPTPDVA
jgi:hypothetical protein